MSWVELVLSFSIPGVVLVMVGTGVIELMLQRRRKRWGTPLTATYINEFTAMFYGTKRTELDNRASMSMMREEDAQGAPPFGVDMERGTVILPKRNADDD